MFRDVLLPSTVCIKEEVNSSAAAFLIISSLARQTNFVPDAFNIDAFVWDCEQPNEGLTPFCTNVREFLRHVDKMFTTSSLPHTDFWRLILPQCNNISYSMTYISLAYPPRNVFISVAERCWHQRTIVQEYLKCGILVRQTSCPGQDVLVIPKIAAAEWECRNIRILPRSPVKESNLHSHASHTESQ